ncbi:Bcr/CflA family efflux MFS transporter [Paludibacterium sp. THUN1379]|uniref:Bcr/CflA family efflux MFS transporter n=1 Tax=Paludibacterium sp. THUN1379 TaxID=3112107 RepID=UPI0030851C3D|nr:Bcr/CflA family efflux MFS transporter [Paludibacterium sp. THUN1379]
MTTVSLALSASRRTAIVRVLLCLLPVIGMVVDLVSPSLPAITLALHTSQTLGQDLISLYLFGYALGNFVTGFLTDAWGRRRLLLAAMSGFMLTSLLPVCWPTIGMLLLTRWLQGLMIGSISVVARSIYSDVLAPSELVRLGVLTGSMFALGPIIGPLLGGYLQVWFGWQASFVSLAALMGLLLLLIRRIVPETHFNRHPLQLAIIRRNLAEVLRHREFMGLVLMMGAVYSLSIAFNTVGPFLIQGRLHYSPIVFGHIALLLGCAFMLATFLCRWLIGRFAVERLQAVATLLLLAVALCGLLAGWWLGSHLALLCIVSALMFCAQGFIFPMSMGKGLAMFGHIAGTATALMFLINTLMTSLTALVLSLLPISDPQDLLWVYLVLSLVCLLAHRMLIQPRPARLARAAG